MSVLEKTVRLEGSRGQAEVLALFDSGATYSCIQPELAERLELLVPLPRPMQFGTAKDGERLSADQRVTLELYIDEQRLSDEFILIPGLAEGVIIGAATLQKWRIKLDFENEQVIVDPRVTHLRII